MSFEPKHYFQYKLLEDETGATKYEKRKIIYFCSVHKWAKENEHVEVLVKKTGNIIKRCIYCERDKFDNKKILMEGWKKEKEEITDYYVRRTLVSGNKNALPMHEYPKVLIETKRASIQLQRETKRLNGVLKTCSKHGDLYSKDIIKKGVTDRGTQQYRCKQCMHEFHQKNYELNKDSILKKQAKYRHDNADKIRKQKHNAYIHDRYKVMATSTLLQRAIRHHNKDQVKKIIETRDQKEAAEITDDYIRRLLAKQTPGIKKEEIPSSMVEVKRALIMLRRGIKVKRDEEIFNYLEKNDVIKDK